LIGQPPEKITKKYPKILANFPECHESPVS
jgi:hypothetical protein